MNSSSGKPACAELAALTLDPPDMKTYHNVPTVELLLVQLCMNC